MLTEGRQLLQLLLGPQQQASWVLVTVCVLLRVCIALCGAFHTVKKKLSCTSGQTQKSQTCCCDQQPKGLLCCDSEPSQPTKQPTHTNFLRQQHRRWLRTGLFGLKAGSPAAPGRAVSKEIGGRTASSGGCCPSPRQLLMPREAQLGRAWHAQWFPLTGHFLERKEGEDAGRGEEKKRGRKWDVKTHKRRKTGLEEGMFGCKKLKGRD